MVGLPGFEPGSIEPKSTSLDQASRQPLIASLEMELRFKSFTSIMLSTLSSALKNRLARTATARDFFAKNRSVTVATAFLEYIEVLLDRLNSLLELCRPLELHSEDQNSARILQENQRLSGIRQVSPGQFSDSQSECRFLIGNGDTRSMFASVLWMNQSTLPAFQKIFRIHCRDI